MRAYPGGAPCEEILGWNINLGGGRRTQQALPPGSQHSDISALPQMSHVMFKDLFSGDLSDTSKKVVAAKVHSTQ